MVVAVHIPRLPLLVALLAARRPSDAPVALGPPPGAPQVLGLCTPAAEAQGVRPGLRVGEALARCPQLDLVVPDPEASAAAAERMVARLEALGAAVEPGEEEGTALFESRGLERLHGGLAGVLRRARAAMPVGADGRVGAAPSRFAALQAAREAPSGRPHVVGPDEVAAFLSPLPVERLPLAPDLHLALRDLGIRTAGAVAALPRAAALERLGFPGLIAWRLARGEADRPLRPRRPPQALVASFEFPEPVGALPALQAAARLLLNELAAGAAGRGNAVRRLTLRARLADGGSWTRDLVLREATGDGERLALAALPRLVEVTGPVTILGIEADASAPLGGRQLTVVATGAEERRSRAQEAARHVRTAQGGDALLRVVEVEPWSRLLERRWALVPYEG